MSSVFKRVTAPQAAQHGFACRLRLREFSICHWGSVVWPIRNPRGDPLLKAGTHIGASGAAGLAIGTSLVGATYSAILRSLGPPALLSANSEMSAPSAGRTHTAGSVLLGGFTILRFGMTIVLRGPAWKLVFRRKPGFRRLPFGYFRFGYPLFGPLFRDHNAVVVAQDVAGLRRCEGVANAADRTINMIVEGSRIIVIG